MKNLIPHLERGETILESLARLNKGHTKKKPKWQNKNRRHGVDTMNVDQEAEDPAKTRRKATVEAITNSATQLLTRGQTNIYEAEREVLMRQFRRETGEDWVDPPAESDREDPDASRGLKQWEYRWSDARDDEEAHGPYDGAMMMLWNNAGFFDDGVEFRNAGEDSEWSRLFDFI